MTINTSFIEKLRAQDEQAFHTLMDIYGDELIRTVYLLTKDFHFAEDICQETFVTVFEKMKQYRGTGTLKGWMMKIAMNHCRARMRRVGWKRLRYKDMRNEVIVSHDKSPEDICSEQSLVDESHKLSYKYREVIVLHYYEDLSIEQMSSRLGTRQGTIKSRLSRARVMLREILGEGDWRS